MTIGRTLLNRFAGDDIKMRRLVTYWGATVLLYLLSISILWVEVLSGAARVEQALPLTILAFSGHALFYVLIRRCESLHLTAAQLSMYQGRFAILCAVLGYSIMGPLRGASLVILTVVLVFCAFTLEARKTHSLSIFAITLLGVAMFSMRYTAPEVFDAKTEVIHFVLSGSMLLVVAILTGRLSELRESLKNQKAELTEALARIQDLATRDELTSLPNRRYMSKVLHDEERRRNTDASPACLAVLDIDWFKKINDAYGHASGDEVLRRFAEEGRLVLRANDVLARWGGEEFLLYFPDTPMIGARDAIERFRRRMESLTFVSGDATFGTTFSAGLIEMMPDETIDAAVRRADALLYHAKANGRNCVIANAAPVGTRTADQACKERHEA